MLVRTRFAKVARAKAICLIGAVAFSVAYEILDRMEA